MANETSGLKPPDQMEYDEVTARSSSINL